MISPELPIKEYTITLHTNEQLVERDYNDLNDSDFIKSLGIDINNVKEIKLTDLI